MPTTSAGPVEPQQDADLQLILEGARTASTALAASTSGQRDAALDAIATALVAAADRVVAAN
ncbi:gamma-glutamyl-phosphate reductase, partial [Clavibacter lycopersici]